MKRFPLWQQILAAIALAVVVGSTVGPDSGLMAWLEPIGRFFMNALKMLVVPLILSSVIVGVASAGGGKDVGRMGARALGFYVLTTLTAVLIALTLVNSVGPGYVDGQPAGPQLALAANADEVQSKVGGRGLSSMVDMLVGIAPANVFKAATEGNLLSLIFFGVLFGVFVARIDAKYGQPLIDMWTGLFHVMMKFTDFVMMLAPIGVFALVAQTVAKAGLDNVAGPIGRFGLVVVAGLAAHAFVVLPLLIWVAGRVSPWGIFRGMSPALLTAFSTASSASTLPVSLDCLEKRVGVSNRVASFVMPLGTSINHAGSALYECAAAMFIAQAYGLHLSFATQFTVVILALVTSMGIASIPAGSLVGIAVILTAVGLPVEAIGVLFVLDRILDMLRTSVNVLADASCTVIVARLEGEKTNLDASANTA
jgi:proton glutamate symport protein